ncbi:MAG TPA: PP2C family protein-serine/threonine phosphatase [Thermomonospora sp.]|nr:PP2C family protein-serine/threonine phosphatase [Thermomonospora sp.]
MREAGEHMLGALVRSTHRSALEDLPGLVAEHARPAGITDPMIYVTDLQQQVLVPLPGQRDERGRPLRSLRIDTTLAGRAYRHVAIVRRPAGEARRLWVPLLDGTERIGVLGVTVERDDDLARERVGRLSALIALLLVSKRTSSDSYQGLARVVPMALSAEITWSLMPPGTFATGDVVVSAVMEPAYVAGGDAYDYALSGGTLHLAVFDAMGHDTAAGLTSTIAMSSSRNNRRHGSGPVDLAAAVDEAVAEQFHEDRYVTGVLADLDTREGVLTWVNRGHPPPLVIRGGRHVATLEGPICPPMGFRLDSPGECSDYRLEPGDRLIFYTDGIVEARNPEGEAFGLARFADFIIRREADRLSVPETLRRLIQTVLAHQRGRLQDDATVLLVEWRGAQEHLMF